MQLQDIIYYFGYGLCHQMPERSLQSDGLYFAVCARDTGIHIGFAVALAVALFGFLRRHRLHKPVPGDLPVMPVMLALLLALVPMALDGFSSYMGLRETTNLMRYVTGAIAGIGLGTLFAPALAASSAFTDHDRPAFSKAPELFWQLAGSTVLAALFYLLHPLLAALAPLIAIIALLAVFVSINMLVLATTVIKKPLSGWLTWLPWLAVSLAATIVELALLALFRHFVINKLTGLGELTAYLPTLLRQSKSEQLATGFRGNLTH